MRGRVPRLHRANRSVRALGAAFLLFLTVAACSANQASLPPFDVGQAIQATQAAGTARFSTTSTLEIAGSGPREFSKAAGVVDLVAVTGRQEGTLIPNPFPPPAQQAVPVEFE